MACRFLGLVEGRNANEVKISCKLGCSEDEKWVVNLAAITAEGARGGGRGPNKSKTVSGRLKLPCVCESKVYHFLMLSSK